MKGDPMKKSFSVVSLVFMTVSASASDLVADCFRKDGAEINSSSSVPARSEIFEQQGCCSWHGGVCGCSIITGRATCCDGATSGCRC